MGGNTDYKFGYFTNRMPLVIYLVRPWTWHFSRYDQAAYIILICAIYTQIGCLCGLLMIRFAVFTSHLIKNHSEAVEKPLDFFSAPPTSTVYTYTNNIDRLVLRFIFRCVHPVLRKISSLTPS